MSGHDEGGTGQPRMQVTVMMRKTPRGSDASHSQVCTYNSCRKVNYYYCFIKPGGVRGSYLRTSSQIICHFFHAASLT